MTTAVTETDVDPDSIDALDFAPSCHVYSRSKNDRCDAPAIAYVEMHRVGECTEPECNARGNMEGNVCQEHLDYFIEVAAEIIKAAEGNRLPSQWRTQIVCPTCQLPLNKASDILQKVIRL